MTCLTSSNRCAGKWIACSVAWAARWGSLQQNLLTVSGARTAEVPEGAQAYRRERFGGEFQRVITLPDDVDPDKVDAVYRDGVLHITVQRREEVQPRKIEVC